MKDMLQRLLVIVFILLTFSEPAFSASRLVRQQAKVYELPHGEAVIVDILAPGMSIEILREQGTWSQVRLPGTAEVGWVESKFLAEPGAAVALARPKTSTGMTTSELEILAGQLLSLDNNLSGIEKRVEGLMTRLETGGESGVKISPQAAQPKGGKVGLGAGLKVSPEEAEMEAKPGAGGIYAWRNSFFMGKYFRGREDFFGLAFSRLLDRGGHNRLDAEVNYSLGSLRGKKDDFIEWSLGSSFNFKPQTYRIYPFLGAHIGMRHRIVDKTVPVNFLLCMPGMGINAELSRIFSLSVDVRAVFLFNNGKRYDEGRVIFVCHYSY
jgi:hypothetical protein